jgi:hypothetical protein
MASELHFVIVFFLQITDISCFMNLVRKLFSKHYGLSRMQEKLLYKKKAIVSGKADKEAVAALIAKLKPMSSPDFKLIRLGPNSDGGYLVPDDLEGISACFSPGVNNVAGFELDCAERGMGVFLADHSVEAPPLDHEQFHFTKKFIGSSSCSTYMTMDEWVNGALSENESDLLLQMDVEGAEYEILFNMSPELFKRFRVIVIEFHFLDQLWSEAFFRVASRAFLRLCDTHQCVHIHPNNSCEAQIEEGIATPPYMEFSFIRRDRISQTTPALEFPHPLDITNVDRAPVDLPSCWYGSEQD